jgi:hypothetical protein
MPLGLINFVCNTVGAAFWLFQAKRHCSTSEQPNAHLVSCHVAEVRSKVKIQAAPEQEPAYLYILKCNV